MVDSFAHQIQSSLNQYVSIKGITVENFSAPTQTETAVTPQLFTRHDVFHYFLSDDIKKILPQFFNTENVSLNCLSNETLCLIH